MALTPAYCSQCGKALASQYLEGQTRLVCSACETVFYQNPLPVAASIVLDEERRVLLVRRARPPHQGAWCLPMGFAELGETIAEAAVRELEEETGIVGKVARLVDAASHESEHYGDLLIVTFEMLDEGGTALAGDDAEEVAYHAIGEHPPLAFPPNERALSICAAAHLEQWEIQDSFVTLQEDTAKTLLSDELVDLIRQSADEITELWLEEVLGNATTKSYRRLDPDKLRERARQAISQFGRWFKGSEASGEVRSFYLALARERRSQGLPLHELLSSLTLLKKHVWTFARSQGVWERPIDVYRVLELNRLMAAFFDRAIFHTARGFEER